MVAILPSLKWEIRVAQQCKSLLQDKQLLSRLRRIGIPEARKYSWRSLKGSVYVTFTSPLVTMNKLCD